MKERIAYTVLCALLVACPAVGQKFDAMPERPRAVDAPGAPLGRENAGPEVSSSIEGLAGIADDLPLTELMRISKLPITEVMPQTRSAKDAQLYKTISPSVVLIVTKTALGSGSLIGEFGEVLTNFHVVKGHAEVGVVFKPAIEGNRPTKENVLTGFAIKYDEIADLALVKVANPPGGGSFLRLGDSSEISVGLDVHAIGHPTGETWTYTKGIISQYRLGFEWQPKGGIKHKADVIQTQTPINPGSSGGPLVGESGTLIGVNSFKEPGEGLNFAVSVDEVKKFLARSGNRVAQQKSASPPPAKASCKSKEVSRWRTKENGNDATVIGFDLVCKGKIDAAFTYFDDPLQPVRLEMDRNHDGRFDVAFFGNRQGIWVLSMWDQKFVGYYDLVGYHDDGTLRPSRFESWEAYKARSGLP
jgi:S1-C subfamily serine protease